METRIVPWYGKTYTQLTESEKAQLVNHISKMSDNRRDDYVLYMTNHEGYTRKQLGLHD
jgi:hypothetical protein